ncbi:MAG: 50S ribosomal protein L11 methyltransferase [Chloroflexi bacterium]|nr:50S ribosomal protein L11 methyltransferase [Chloroflexota bacterium]
MSQWLELWTSAEAEAADAVAEVLQRWGQGVAIEEPVVVSADGESVQVDPNRPAILRTYLPLDESTAGRRQQLEQAIWHLGQLRHVEPLQARVLAETEWADAWKRHFFVQHVGERIAIVPSWRRHRPGADEVVVRLDPGMAFGTGLHPTTRLCLVALERWLRPGMRVLDLGTGSGILAVAAAKLGAGAVCALDIDPLAVRVATENVRRNRVQRRVSAQLGSLPLAPRPEPFDLVVANISLRVNLELLGEVRAVLAPAGLAILSGVLAEAQETLLAALAREGFERLEVRQEGDWIAVVAR